VLENADESWNDQWKEVISKCDLCIRVVRASTELGAFQKHWEVALLAFQVKLPWLSLARFSRLPRLSTSSWAARYIRSEYSDYNSYSPHKNADQPSSRPRDVEIIVCRPQKFKSQREI
jgi:hypothetical protein